MGGAAYCRLIGLEVTVTPTVENCWALICLGKGQERQTNLDGIPHDIILDRVHAHGDPKQNRFRCVSLNSARTSVINCCLTEDYAGGDYRLAESSKYRGLGTDGKDLGADFTELNAALQRARTH